jgi:hypothetical protein
MVHDYLGMELDYRKQGELKINMTKYVENMINEFLVKLGKKDVAKTPAGDNLFNLGTGAELDMKRSEIFHTFVAKGVCLCKRARLDIQQAILVLCTRAKDPNQADWEKLMRVMKCLNKTRDEYLTLSADDLRVVKWYVDTSFAVHPDFKSHTSAVMMTINQTIRFRSAIPIENRRHKEYYCVLDMVLCLYSSAGFHIKTIHCEGSSAR